MPDVIITPSSGLIDFFPASSRVSRIEASGNTFNLVNTANSSGTIFNVEATNGSLFSVVDNLNGTLMSVNNNAGLPVFEVFSDDKIVGGRFNQNDFVISSSGNVGLGTSSPSGKLHVYSATSGDIVLNTQGTNGSLFSVVDNLSGVLMSVTKSGGIPIFEVFSDDRVVGGRYGENDFVINSSGNVGVGISLPSGKFHVVGDSVFGGNVLCDKLYLERLSSPAISSSTLTLNLSYSQLFNVNLNSNITTLTISNVPSTSNATVGFSVIFTADGTARSVTWPSGIKWPSASAPTLTSASGKIDVLSFISTNSGVNWLGFVGGQNY